MRESPRARLAAVLVSTTLLLLATASCVSKDEAPDRGVAGTYQTTADGNNFPKSPQLMEVIQEDAKVSGGNIEFTEGITSTKDAADLWHLTEGSDIFPMAWFQKMRSQVSGLAEETRLHEKLDVKYGVIKEPASVANSHRYPYKWVGVTASWSESNPMTADVKLSQGQTIEDVIKKRMNGGKESVAMIGVNCAFCHTNEIRVNGRSKIVEGAPNMLNIRGFFQDLLGTTAKTMLTEELLEQFLNDMAVPGDNKAAAKSFVAGFKKELGLDSVITTLMGEGADLANRVMGRLGRKSYLYEAFSSRKNTKIREVFFQKRDVVAKYLTALLKKTYGLNEVSPELRMRMDWLSKSLGVDPTLKVTPEGYSRTDAFGRIANWVARVDKPISLDATVSVPAMWGIQYRSMFHWNANTNSVVMRNMGQSFGLGSILTNPDAKDESKWASTTNLHNLHTIEKLLYKIHVPQFQEYSTEIDIQKAVAGCNTFQTTCAGCHTAHNERVGPQSKLIDYKVLPLQTVGTDSVYTKNQATPVGQTAFKDALFAFTGKTRDSYYKRNNISREQQKQWEMYELRGEELFRDTYLGESRGKGITSYINIPAKPAPGYTARNLAGAWATAPYLHNGAVPSIADLLKPSAQRPKIFFLGSRDLDTKTLGFKHDMSILPSLEGVAEKAREIQKAKKISQQLAMQEAACELFPARCFDVRWTGNSNAGHEGPKFGTDLPAEKKAELIEFLKVVRAEPEYSRNLAPLYRFDGKTCSPVQ